MMRQTGNGGRYGTPIPKYTAEFKRRAAGLYRERGCTYAELAREPGCDAGGISDRVHSVKSESTE